MSAYPLSTTYFNGKLGWSYGQKYLIKIRSHQSILDRYLAACLWSGGTQSSTFRVCLMCIHSSAWMYYDPYTCSSRVARIRMYPPRGGVQNPSVWYTEGRGWFVKRWIFIIGDECNKPEQPTSWDRSVFHQCLIFKMPIYSAIIINSDNYQVSFYFVLKQLPYVACKRALVCTDS